MQQYPDYKYRPRRRPKNKIGKGKMSSSLSFPARMSPTSPAGLTPPATPTKPSPLDLTYVKTEEAAPCSNSLYTPAMPYGSPDGVSVDYVNSFVFPQHKTFYPTQYYTDYDSYYTQMSPPTSVSPQSYSQPSPPMNPRTRPGLQRTAPQSCSLLQQLYDHDYNDIQPDEFDQYLTDSTVVSTPCDENSQQSL